MKLSYIIILSFLIVGCKTENDLKKDEKQGTVTKVTVPNNGAQKGKITNLKFGCNFNKTANGSQIEIYLPDNKEIEELKGITSFSGIPLNFKIYSAKINNAIATIIDNERYIIYDTDLLSFANTKTESFWSSISILAHEIGHHLSGHTLNQLTDSHKAELEADKFSGFTLYKMGASLEQSLKAMKSLGNNSNSDSHPNKYDRIKAITDGWNEAYSQDYLSALPPPLNDDPNKFYEYTMEMLYNKQFLDFYSQDFFTKYDFVYGVVTDVETDKYYNVKNVSVEIIKPGKQFENSNQSSQRGSLTMWVDSGFEMCNACWKNLNGLLKPGRRVKFAYNEGHPEGGTSYNGVFHLSYVKAVSPKEIEFYSLNSNKTGVTKIINDFLIAEEDRDINKILSFFSKDIYKYWQLDYPSRKDLIDQYERAWFYSKNARNLVQSIKKRNSNTYILSTNFRFYDIKKEKYRDIVSKVRFVFDNQNKIISINGV